MTAQANGKVNVDNYTFDQDTAREELGNMIVLHDYPLSIVDHAGFRRFVHAVQPLFNLHTRNTIRFVHLSTSSHFFFLPSSFVIVELSFIFCFVGRI
jgi:hypothetical protein